MAIACGMSVANGYYNQPLLAQIERSLDISVQQVGLMPMFTQIGIAIGVFLLVPLGDLVESRRLMMIMLCANAGALVAVALAPSLNWLIVSSLVMGITTVVPYLIPPFAAHLAAPQERGKVVGMITSGIFFGILLARTVSGFVGAAFGWRSMYAIASGLMIFLAIILLRFLPTSQPSSRMSYPQLIRSLWELVTQQPLLRQAAIVQAMLFGTFNAFWTTLIFLLESPSYHYGSQVAGLFGLIGVIGAMAAPLVGRLADRKGPRLAVGIAIAITLASWVVLWLFGYQLLGLIVGVILLDLGVQAGHVSNQALIYSLLPEARSRLNTVYVVLAFVGAAIGSSLAAYSWSVWQWQGVSILSLFMVFVAGATYWWENTKRKFLLMK